MKIIKDPKSKRSYTSKINRAKSEYAKQLGMADDDVRSSSLADLQKIAVDRNVEVKLNVPRSYN